MAITKRSSLKEILGVMERRPHLFMASIESFEAVFSFEKEKPFYAPNLNAKHRRWVKRNIRKIETFWWPRFLVARMAYNVAEGWDDFEHLDCREDLTEHLPHLLGMLVRTIAYGTTTDLGIEGMLIYQIELMSQYATGYDVSFFSTPQAFGLGFVATHLASSFTNLYKKTVGIVGGGIINFANWAQERLKEILAACCPSALDFFPWLLKCKEKIEKWTKSALESAGFVLELFGDLFVWGVGTITVAAILMLLERFLLKAGIMERKVGMAHTFAVAALACMGVQFLHKTGDLGRAQEFGKKVCELTKGVLVAIVKRMEMSVSFSSANVHPRIEEAPRFSEVQFSPLMILETIAKAITTTDAKTFEQCGRIMQAATNIKNGVSHLYTIGANILIWLAKTVAGLLGRDEWLLNDLGTMLGYDLPSWFSVCQRLSEQFALKGCLERGVFTELLVAREIGNQINANIIRQQVKISPPVITMIKGVRDKLEELYKTASLLGQPGDRKTPFTIFFQGVAGCGKTTVATKLMVDFCRHYGLDPQEQKYSRNCADAFWSGYRRQFVVYYDDFGAVVRNGMEPDEQTLFPLVSSSQMPLNMASLEEKGMLFDSPLMVFTQNHEEPSADAKIHDLAAYRRRRHVYIKVTNREGMNFDPRNPTANQLYHLRRYNDKDDVYFTQQVFETYEDLFVFCLNGFEVHGKKEQEMLESTYGTTSWEEQRAEINKKFLSDLSICVAKSMNIEVPPIEGERKAHYATDRNGNTFVWDGEDVTCIGKIFSGKELTAAQSATNRMSLFFYSTVQRNKNVPTSLCLYLHMFARSGVFTPEYMVIPDQVELALRTLCAEINTLPLWQRIALDQMGSFLGAPKKGWWSEAWSRMQSTLRAIYEEEVALWPLAMKVLVGVVLTGVFGMALWQGLAIFKSFGAGTAFATGMATEFTQTQSVRPNRVDVSEYRFRNAPMRARAWSKPQFNFEQSHSAIVDRTLAMLRAGTDEIQVCMLPNQQFVVFRHFLVRHKRPIQCILYHSAHEYHFVLDTRKEKGNVIEWEDSELCVYRSVQLPMIEATTWDLICMDSEAVLPSAFSAIMMGCKYVGLAGSYSPFYASIDARTCDQTLELASTEYQRTIKKYIYYEGETMEGDCGSMIVAQIAGKWQIVGMHVGGDGSRGQACFFRSFARGAKPQSAGQYFEIFTTPAFSTNGYSLVGEAKPSTFVHSPAKTHLFKLGEEYDLGIPCTKIPAILAKGDERLIGTVHEGFDPYVEGMKKYSQPMNLLEEEKLQRTADEIVETWFDCSVGFEFGEVSLDHAINGIEGLDYFESLVLNTSEGFPYVLGRKPGEKGKARFLEGSPGCFTIVDEEVLKNLKDLRETAKTEVPELICIECPKDEKVAPRKVYVKPKTRLFSILPFHFNLFVRMQELNFVRFIMKNRGNLPCKVGVNPASQEWGRIADNLLEVGNQILCCDYSLFDGIMSKQIMEVIADMINKLCQGSPELCAQRKNTLMACITRYGICKKALYRVQCGIPSGFPLTVIINSIFNEILVRYCYKHIMAVAKPEEPCLQNMFDKYIRLAVYGDDNLISVSPAISSIFNGSSIKEAMASFGVTITDGVDKLLPSIAFRPIQECDFLKRKFVHRGGLVWDAPIELESLWAQMHYVSTKNLGEREAFAVNCVNVLRELYMHDPEDCRALRTKIIQKFPWVRSFGFPTIAEIEGHFDKQRNFQGYKGATVSLDLLMNPQLLGHIDYDTNEQFMQVEGELVPNVNVVLKANYVARERDFVVLIGNIGKQRSEPERVMDLRWPTGAGKGSMPSTEWVRTRFLNHRSECHKKLWSVCKSGRNLVFVSTTNSTIPALLLATMFCRSINKLDVESCNVLATRGLEACASLKYLYIDFKDIFFC
jgi:hypothetical protein